MLQDAKQPICRLIDQEFISLCGHNAKELPSKVSNNGPYEPLFMLLFVSM